VCFTLADNFTSFARFPATKYRRGYGKTTEASGNR